MKRIILVLLTILLLSTTLSACGNTIKGIGKDMQRTGERITDSMKDYD